MIAAAYVERHDRIVKYIHWCVCNDDVVSELPPAWFNHELTEFVEKGAIQIHWEWPVTTNRPITTKKLDIVDVDRQCKLNLLIDISVPRDWNVSTRG